MIRKKILAFSVLAALSVGTSAYLFNSDPGHDPLRPSPRSVAAESSEPEGSDSPRVARQSNEATGDSGGRSAEASQDETTKQLHSSPSNEADSYKGPSKILAAADTIVEHEYQVLADLNDPYSGQWYEDVLELDDIRDPEAEDSGLTLAVIDTGFALAHEEFEGRWASNNGETGNTQEGDRCWSGVAQSKQTNNCDDDNNGFIDDVSGWDFVNADNEPQAGTGSQVNGNAAHGTMVAGLAAASGNNDVGIAGVNLTAKIMPLQALSDTGSGYTSSVVAAIEYAADNGADVINLSLGTTANDALLREAVAYAEAQGAVVIAAAGNCGSSGCGLSAGNTVLYPARYDSVVAVAATTSLGQVASFSSRGPTVDVAAPGSAITTSASWSSNNESSAYAHQISGTSLSAPIVSGMALYAVEKAPLAEPAEIAGMLRATASPASGLERGERNDTFGYGIVNLPRIVAYATFFDNTQDVAGAREFDDEATMASTAGVIYKQNSSNTIAAACVALPGEECVMSLEHETGGYSGQTSKKTNQDGYAIWLFDNLANGDWKVHSGTHKLAAEPAEFTIE